MLSFLNPSYIVLVIVILWLTGCTPIDPGPLCISDGTVYGRIRSEDFKGRWFNYYERGLSYMEGQCYSAALSDLKKSLKEKVLEAHDAKAVITYGMHLISYFPNREMGIIYYLTSDETADPVPSLYTAREKLETSLQYAPTVKAKKWLAKVTRRILELESRKKSVPLIHIHTIAGQPYSRGIVVKSAREQIEINGTASDQHYISSIHIGKITIQIDGTQTKVPFKKTLALAEGQHDIQVSASNFLGITDTQMIKLFIDQTGPEITITEQNMGVIRGYVEDDSHIKSLIVNIDDIETPVKTDLNGNFEYLYHVPASQVVIYSEDELGNSSRILMSNDLRMEKNNRFYANNSMFSQYDDCTTKTEIDQPQIIFHGWPETETVFVDNILIEGQVQKYQQLEKLYVQVNDGQKINKLKSTKKTGKKKSFSHKMKLVPGNNHLTVYAKDVTGNINFKTISIFKKIQRVNQLKHRYRIKLSEPDKIDISVDYSFPETFYPKFSKNMKYQFKQLLLQYLQHGKRFLVIDRDNAKNNAILLADTTRTHLGIEIFMSLVDIETDEILAEFNDYAFSSDNQALKELTQFCTTELCKRFPIFYGVINKKLEKDIIVVLKKSDPISSKDNIYNWPIIYFIKEAPRFNPVNKKVLLGSDTTIIGFGKILEPVDPMTFIAKGLNAASIGCEVMRK